MAPVASVRSLESDLRLQLSDRGEGRWPLTNTTA
jgi:hypothetical protein